MSSFCSYFIMQFSFTLNLPSLDPVQWGQPSPLRFTDEAILDVPLPAAGAVNGISSFRLTPVKVKSQVSVSLLGANQDLWKLPA